MRAARAVQAARAVPSAVPSRRATGHPGLPGRSPRPREPVLLCSRARLGETQRRVADGAGSGLSWVQIPTPAPERAERCWTLISTSPGTCLYGTGDVVYCNTCLFRLRGWIERDNIRR